MDERTRSVLIDPSEPIGAALRRMDATGSGIVLVVAEDGKLLGVATDGDMRRWIIAGKAFDDPVGAAMNPRPCTIRESWVRERVEHLMAERHFECIPVLDERGRVVDAVWWHDLMEGHARRAERSTLDLPVVVMAGGRGTRLAPYTHILPKPLVPVGDKPIAQLIMDRFFEWGCHHFFLMLHHKASLVRAYFDDIAVPYAMEYTVEGEPLGTAGALSLLKGRLDTTFFLTNCDILVDADYADVVRFHRDGKHDITFVASMKHFTIPYGVCHVGEGSQLTRIVEKPASDHLVSTGMYVLEPHVLNDVPEGTLFHMSDLANVYLAQGRSLGVYPVSEGSWLDMGAIDELHVMLDRLGTHDRG